MKRNPAATGVAFQILKHRHGRMVVQGKGPLLRPAAATGTVMPVLQYL